MEAQNTNIRLLTQDNWTSWAQDVKVLLMDRGCYSFVDETEPAIDTKTAPRNEVVDYNLRRDRAYTTIYGSISPEFRNLISDTTDCVKAYKILKDYFEPTTLARIIYLFEEFLQTRFDPSCETICIFCSRLRQLVQRLKDAGHVLDDFLQSYQLLRNLPAEYFGIVQLIYRWSDEEFKFDKIVKELILEENRLAQAMKNAECANTSMSGVYNKFVKPKTGSANVKVRKKQIFEKPPMTPKIIGPCFRCGEFGHIKSQCTKKPPQKVPQKKSVTPPNGHTIQKI